MDAGSVVLVLVLATEASQPQTRSMTTAARKSLGPSSVVLVQEVNERPDETQATRFGGQVHADAIVLVDWSQPDHERAVVHLYEAERRGWLDRTLIFGSADALSERGRTVGLAVLSMMGREPVATSGPDGTPSGPGPAGSAASPKAAPSPPPRNPSSTTTATGTSAPAGPTGTSTTKGTLAPAPASTPAAPAAAPSAAPSASVPSPAPTSTATPSSIAAPTPLPTPGRPGQPTSPIRDEPPSRPSVRYPSGLRPLGEVTFGGGIGGTVPPTLGPRLSIGFGTDRWQIHLGGAYESAPGIRAYAIRTWRVSAGASLVFWSSRYATAAVRADALMLIHSVAMAGTTQSSLDREVVGAKLGLVLTVPLTAHWAVVAEAGPETSFGETPITIDGEALATFPLVRFQAAAGVRWKL